MHFYVVQGPQGMKRLFRAAGGADQGMKLLHAVFKAGPQRAGDVIAEAGLTAPQQWLAFFFPPAQREVYFFLDLRVARTTDWWYWLGTWDVGRKDGRRSKFRLVRNVRRADKVYIGRGLEADLDKGRVTFHGTTYPISKAFVRKGDHTSHTTYSTTEGVVFYLNTETRVGAVMEQEFSGSVFSQLFMTSGGDARYFTRVAERFPYYQIWRVTADRQ